MRNMRELWYMCIIEARSQQLFIYVDRLGLYYRSNELLA